MSPSEHLSVVIRERRLVQSWTALKPFLIVFFAGMNLILIEWILIHELTALLLGTELVALLVTICYFIGLSIGYRFSRQLPRTLLVPLALITLLLHVTLPIWFRLLTAELINIDAYWAAFIVLPLLTPFVISAFYSMFLPRLVDAGEQELPPLYASELLGPGAGILALMVVGQLGLNAIYAAYIVGLLLILLALGLRAPLLVLLTAVCIMWLLAFPAANDWSNSLWFRAVHRLPEGTFTAFTGMSPYQKVDVLETPIGVRHLYLDGLEHFGTDDESRLNVILGDVPALLTQPQTALVIGAGSMQMERLIAEHGTQVTTVEIDPMVVDVSLSLFDSVNAMSRLTNRSIVIDDAKHYLGSTTQLFDLIATDTPAPYALQTASLYSVPFYQLIADHLTPNGVLAANLTSTFAPDDYVSHRVAASLLGAFKQVMVVTPVSAGWSFAFAADQLPFDQAALADALSASGETEFTVFDTPVVRAMVGDAQPITPDSMDIVLQISANWIYGRVRR